MFIFNRKTAYELGISDWSSDVCSSVLREVAAFLRDDYNARMLRRQLEMDRPDVTLCGGDSSTRLGPGPTAFVFELLVCIRPPYGSEVQEGPHRLDRADRKSTRLNSSH